MYTAHPHAVVRAPEWSLAHTAACSGQMADGSWLLAERRAQRVGSGEMDAGCTFVPARFIAQGLNPPDPGHRGSRGRALWAPSPWCVQSAGAKPGPQ